MTGRRISSWPTWLWNRPIPALKTSWLDNSSRCYGTRLTLSTIHSAKGLGVAQVVFIIWALDGRFPDRRALDRHDADMEEERRLMYVADDTSPRQL